MSRTFAGRQLCHCSRASSSTHSHPPSFALVCSFLLSLSTLSRSSFEICTKRGVLGACKKTVRRTSENDNDKSGKYQKPQTQKVAQKDLEMRLGADGAVTSDVLTILKQRTEDNRERNLRIVEQKTFEANQSGYIGPFDKKIIIQNYGELGSKEASAYTLLDKPQAMRLKKAGYIEGTKFVKPVTQEIIDEAAKVSEGGGKRANMQKERKKSSQKKKRNQVKSASI